MSQKKIERLSEVKTGARIKVNPMLASKTLASKALASKALASKTLASKSAT